MDFEQYISIFIDESKENLQKLNENLLKLEQSPEDIDVVNEIFRVAHTLKGMSKTMGFNVIGNLTHEMENILDSLRNGEIKVDETIIDILFTCLDTLEKLVDSVISGESIEEESFIAELVSQLKSISVDEAEITKAIKTEIIFNEFELNVANNAQKDGFNVSQIDVELSDTCVLMGARAYMVIKALENEGELVKSVPIVEDIESGELDHNEFFLFFISKKTNEELEAKILSVPEVEKVTITEYSLEEHTSALTKTVESDDENVKKDIKKVVKTTSKVASQTIRVNSDKLDTLMNLVGELVINRTRVSQLASDYKLDDLSTSVSMFENITNEIQDIVMKLRMVPIDQVFNRFPRVVRDIAKAQNKDINLVITGKDTEIDRVVIDEIGDPLVHLIRNSLDHGIETPEVRIQKNKTPKGTLELSAFNEGDNIVIKISDDGKGIDPKVIKELAIKKGVIEASVAATLDNKQILELIFKPGFSTNEVATDLSGRGVGMDVVKSNVSKLGGNVSIYSEVNVGTTMTISLPSKMAIVQSLLIKVGDETFATPLNNISEVIDIEPKDIKQIQNNEVFVLRDKTLSLIRLNELLEVKPSKNNQNESETSTIVVVKAQGRYVGLMVDDLIGQQEIVIKPMNKKMCSKDYLSGATTLGNGKVALILNVNALN